MFGSHTSIGIGTGKTNRTNMNAEIVDKKQKYKETLGV